jgi:1-aminocyclopropane-1-carboxylate deaminase
VLDLSRSILVQVNDPVLEAHNVELFIKRDDLLDSEISGNKWRKLKFNVAQCIHMKNRGVLTFGGAFSNHLVATAAACKKAGIDSIGIVRGDELNENSNDTLRRCASYGMQLIFVSRSEYLMRYERAYHEDLLTQFPNFYIVPEGGANYYGMIGCQEILAEVEESFDRVVLAQGTTATSCGVGLSLYENQTMSVVPVMKGYDSLSEMRGLMGKSGISDEAIEEVLERTNVLSEYHFGGYGKYTSDLLAFIRSFYASNGIKIDPVYTGKAMFALYDQVKKGSWENEKILFIHTGGLQGAASIEKKSGINLFGD